MPNPPRSTPFDAVVLDAIRRGFHNHRLEDHSDIVSAGILKDLVEQCPTLSEDVREGVVRHWTNVPAPGARQRKVDLLVGEPSQEDDGPDLTRVRICVENKSVTTAHRNRDARFDDLNEALQVLHRVKADTVLVATVLVGVAPRVLNVPDKLKTPYKGRDDEFRQKVLPRLSTGDQTLWKEFEWAISINRPGDARKTVEKFRQLPRRPPGHTHLAGDDYVLLVPMHIDNVNPPRVARENDLGIDIDGEYQAMLSQICKAYTARWHL
jgi:hypothetical protein